MGKKTRLSGADRRQMILDAALDIFAQKGYNGARTKEIAQAAGISETLVFQHFRTKRELYLAAVESLFGGHPVLEDIEEAMKQKDDAAVLTALAAHMVHHSRQDPRIVRLALFRGLEQIEVADEEPGVEDKRQSQVDILAGYFRSRMDDGVFRKMNCHIAAQLFIQTVSMYIADQQTQISGSSPSLDDTEVIQTLVDVYLGGMTERQ